MGPDAPQASQASSSAEIRAIDSHSVHRITSGQVVIDLQTAVKELVENSLDAGATNIEVRFKDYGLKSIEVVDNGTGVSKENYETLALKHHTSKLSKFEDLSTVVSFGFRGEALASLCALSESVTFITATAPEAPMGTVLEMERSGKLKSSTGKAARQRGTTATVNGIFTPLPVRRKELERNIKREFAKALSLLNAYALLPCAQENKGVRLTVYNHPDGGRRTLQLRTDGSLSIRASVSALWGPKSLDSLVPLDLTLTVDAEKTLLKRQGLSERSTEVRVQGLVSDFAHGCGRVGNDRQFFYVNGRPCYPSKIQKAFNEVYKTFNSNQAPFIVADFKLPTDAYDINVSPDKRTIFIHSETNLVIALKSALEIEFSSARSTFAVNGASSKGSTQSQLNTKRAQSTLEDVELSTPGPSTPPPDSTLKPPPLIKYPGMVPGGPLPLRYAGGGRAGWPTEPEAEVEDEASVDPSISQSPARKPSPSTTRSHTPVHAPDATPATGRSVTPPLTQLPPNTIKHVITPIGPKAPIKRPAPVDTETENAEESIASSSQRPIQMVLSTSGASWNLQKGDGEDGERTKRAKLGAASGAKGKAAQLNLREQLLGFARTGSQSTTVSASQDDIDMGEEEEEEEEDGTYDDGAAEGGNMDEDVISVGTGEIVDEDEAPSKVRSRRWRKRPRSPSPVPPRPTPPRIETLSEEPEEEDRPLARSSSSRLSSSDIELPPQPETGRRLLETSRKKPRHSSSSDAIDLTGDGDDIFGVNNHLDDEPQPSSKKLLFNDSDEEQEDVDMLNAEDPVEVRRTKMGTDGSTISFPMESITQRWKHLNCEAVSTPPSTSAPIISVKSSAGATNASTDGSAERELSRVVFKDDFEKMEVIGQFNLGFIIARRRKDVSTRRGGEDKQASPDDRRGHGTEEAGNVVADDLFLVDQHAADEKYNFETLQLTTKIQSQRLVRPRPLELSASDEIVAMENIDVLRTNGFEVSFDENALPGRGERIQLVAQPMSKDTVFDMKDLEELLHLMQDQPAGQMVRCSKARAMFASRACRKSVMVGRALTTGQMTSVLRHMATMDQPWNCPHGRPTMRHLCQLKSNKLQASSTRKVDWRALSE